MKFTISIENKIAVPVNAPEIICGNSDYVIEFAFDNEWNDYEVKTARFTFKLNGENVWKETVFTGTECKMPVMSNITEVYVGVYAGELSTTTPAKLTCKKSILCSSSMHKAPEDDVYIQLLNLLKDNFPVDVALQVSEELKKLEEIKNGIEQTVQEYKDIYDSMQETHIAKAGDTMTGLLTLSADPTQIMHAATKQYVDNNKIKMKAGYYTGNGNTYNGDIYKSIALGFSPQIVFLFRVPMPGEDYFLTPPAVCVFTNHAKSDKQEFLMYNGYNYGIIAQGMSKMDSFMWNATEKLWNTKSKEDTENNIIKGSGLFIRTRTTAHNPSDVYNADGETYGYIAIGQKENA